MFRELTWTLNGEPKIKIERGKTSNQADCFRTWANMNGRWQLTESVSFNNGIRSEEQALDVLRYNAKYMMERVSS